MVYERTGMVLVSIFCVLISGLKSGRLGQHLFHVKSGRLFPIFLWCVSSAEGTVLYNRNMNKAFLTRIERNLGSLPNKL